MMLRLLLWVLFCLPNIAWACSCAHEPGGMSRRVDKAEMVLVVRVLASELVEVEDRRRSYIRARFEVLETIKGSASGVAGLRTPLSSCGLGLAAGGYYLLISAKSMPETEVHFCTGSRALSSWQDDLQVDAIRNLVARRVPIHQCDNWVGVPPPPSDSDTCREREHKEWMRKHMEREKAKRAKPAA